MNARLFFLRGVALLPKAACALFVMIAASAGPARAQYAGAPAKLTPTVDNSAAIVDSNVVQAGCSSCGSSLMGGSASSCASCAAGSSDPCAGGCYPGRKKCDTCCLGDGFGGRFLGGILECLCCPDPCYEPHWNPLADSAFFVDAARPMTQMRIRGDWASNLIQPDRAEYFWGKIGSKGPTGVKVRKLDYQELSMYNEVAAGNFGFFVEVPYLHFDTEGSPDISKSGFADMNLGTKSLLLDCELLQLALQFKTYLPIGDFHSGLGVAHVSLEPGFLFSLKLSQEAYLQAQTSLWIPIGGDNAYESAIWHSHLSFNHMLWHPCSTILLVGTIEANEWSIINGQYTSATGQTVPGHGEIFSTGPGARLFICDKIDLGVGTAFSVTGSHFAQDLIRTEFRWRF